MVCVRWVELVKGGEPGVGCGTFCQGGMGNQKSTKAMWEYLDPGKRGKAVGTQKTLLISRWTLRKPKFALKSDETREEGQILAQKALRTADEVIVHFEKRYEEKGRQ